MKVMTILGTRPEIIRLSCIIPKLDKACRHVLIHTGQSYDPEMSDIFFQELGIRKPDYYLGVRSTIFARQIGKMFVGIGEVITKENPDRVLVLGDTNSALSAFIAKRMRVPVYHMEAGNRCYDDRVPEEVNRRLVDHASDVLMPYTERSRANLLREGIANNRIFVTGNPIYEVLNSRDGNLSILNDIGLSTGGYFLVTAHRQENVDDKERLKLLVFACSCLATKYKVPVIFSRHPRTAKRMKALNIGGENITFYKPFGFLDFLALERNALCVLTDSGTVQEECCISGVRCVTLRDTTERPETIECGSNILASVDPDSVLRCVNLMLSLKPEWQPPVEYLVPDVSDNVAKILTSYGEQPR